MSKHSSESKMTTGERQELGKVVRKRAKLAMHDAEQRGAWLPANGYARRPPRDRRGARLDTNSAN